MTAATEQPADLPGIGVNNDWLAPMEGKSHVLLFWSCPVIDYRLNASCLC